MGCHCFQHSSPRSPPSSLSLFSSLLFCSLCTLCALWDPPSPHYFLPSLLLASLSLCGSRWEQGPFARLRTFSNSILSMGWMAKKGALTSPLWKVKHSNSPPHIHTQPMWRVQSLYLSSSCQSCGLLFFCAFEKQHSGSHKHQCSFWIKLMQHSLLCRITVCEKMFEHVYHVYLLERRKFANIVTKTPVEVQKQL